jgi:hypothetical protein
MLFMTGDGHRNPPFVWTSRGLWGRFFRDVVQMNKVCCHVELFANQVTRDAVPDNLVQVFDNGKVFGWEPEIYQKIHTILENSPALFLDDRLNYAQHRPQIQAMVSNVSEVGDAGLLVDHSFTAVHIYSNLQVGTIEGRDDLVASNISALKILLRQYYRDAMSLRTDINNMIGANIQAKIDDYPDHLHLITCGDAHITVNPLYAFITPPAGCFGVVDENQG